MYPDSEHVKGIFANKIVNFFKRLQNLYQVIVIMFTYFWTTK